MQIASVIWAIGRRRPCCDRAGSWGPARRRRPGWL